MANERISIAINRIERAIARAEILATRPQNSPARQPDEDPELARRHDSLRDQVETAVARIDALIRSGEA